MGAKEFCSILKKLRSEMNLTQRDLAKKLGISSSLVGMWETNSRLPSPELYEQIADFFNVDMDYLYGRSEVRRKISFDPDGNAQFVLSEDLELLVFCYNQLNSEGKAVALERIREMTELSKYTKS